MPEQAEWVEDDDYSYAWKVKPVTAPAKATLTPDEPTDQRIADLEVALKIVMDEMQHLREDIKRMKAGESEL